MVKKIITAAAIILLAMFLLLCGASADPAVTAHNTYLEDVLESVEDTADTEASESTDVSEDTAISESDTDPAPTETETEAVSETETETETESEVITEETSAPAEVPSTDDATPLPEETVTETTTVVTEPVTEAVTEAILSFDPPVKELPMLQTSGSIDPSKPMVALTFDDGPSQHTDRLLDILATHGGKATFFLVGGNVDYRPDTVKRITADGHEIGGHSIDHKQLTRLSSDEVMRQLSSPRERMYAITGTDSYLVRPPYGAYNDEVKRIAAGLGIVFVNWSVDTLDWKYRNAETVHKKIMNSAYDGAIILCHDIHKTTVDAMETVIPALIAKGYQLVTVSDLLSINHDILTAGAVYNRK
ncbi:MAG: polysaccharide deacetylase family protein [Clostridia bacterium]|nr:polysaccharide deacetylase family protein [Clostridia bacterium]